MGGTPINRAYAIACGIKTTPTVKPAMASDFNIEIEYPLFSKACKKGIILWNVLTLFYNLGLWRKFTIVCKLLPKYSLYYL